MKILFLPSIGRTCEMKPPTKGLSTRKPDTDGDLGIITQNEKALDEFL